MPTKASSRSARLEKGDQVVVRAASPALRTPAMNGSSIDRLNTARNELCHATAELESALMELGVVSGTTYGDIRDTPKAALEDIPSVLDTLSSLNGEAQSISSRFDEFVWGEDREDTDADSDSDIGVEEDRTKSAAEKTAYGRKFKQVADSICENFANISSYVGRLQDSLLSRPSAGELGAESGCKEVSPESVIELLEYVELRTSNLTSRIHTLTADIKATF